MLDLREKQIIVTGGAGFLGTAVCRVLRARGVPADRIFVPRRRDYDLTIESHVERLYDDARPDVVIHLAAEVGGIGSSPRPSWAASAASATIDHHLGPTMPHPRSRTIVPA